MTQETEHDVTHGRFAVITATTQSWIVQLKLPNGATDTTQKIVVEKNPTMGEQPLVPFLRRLCQEVDLQTRILVQWERVAGENLPSCPQLHNALSNGDVGTRHFELRGFISGELRSAKQASKLEPVAESITVESMKPRPTLAEVMGVTGEDPDFGPLFAAVVGCLRQVTHGKGKERHARGRDFIDQPIMAIPRLLGGEVGLGGLLYQAIKKAEESVDMPRDRRIAELRGAVIYLLAAIMHEESR